jgi:hypothetical protein
MSFFIGNTANVFEFYALHAFALGTFALMYFGLAIEQAAFEGDFTHSYTFTFRAPPFSPLHGSRLSVTSPPTCFASAASIHRNPMSVILVQTDVILTALFQGFLLYTVPYVDHKLIVFVSFDAWY